MRYFSKERLLSLLLTGALIVGSSPSVLALDGYNEVTTAGGTGDSIVTLTVENTGGGGGDTPVDPDNPDVPPVDPVIFSAYVPAELPIKMDLDGNIVVPDNAMIINAVETKGIKVSEINVAVEDGWRIDGYDENFDKWLPDFQVFGLKFRSDNLETDGSFPLSENDWKIAKNSYIDLNMGFKTSRQTAATNYGKIATVSFTLDWSGDDISTGPSIPDIGGDIPTPPVVEQFTVNFISDDNGNVTGNSSIQIDKDGTLTFPSVLANEGYVFDKWINADTNEEVTTDTVVKGNMSVKAIFSKVTSPSDWFTTDGSILTGMSDKGFTALSSGNTDLIVPEVINGRTITAVAPNAFYAATSSSAPHYEDYRKITSIVLPDTVTDIGEGAFVWCMGLLSVDIGKGVTKINPRVFYGCIYLKSISSLENITSIGPWAFKECSRLEDLSISDKVIEIGEQAFVNVPHIEYHGTATGAPWGAKSMN